MKKVISIIIVLLIAVSIAFAFNVANEEKTIEENTKFSVSIKGETLKETNDMSFAYGVDYTFNVSKGYTLEILPNADVEESNFFFYVDGKPYYFRAETKLIDAFLVYTLKNNTFMVSAPANSNLLNMLRVIYPEQEVRFKQGEDHSNVTEKIFSLVIREKNGNDKIVVNFGLVGMTIELPTEIVF